jgi:hypothetical protein
MVRQFLIMIQEYWQEARRKLFVLPGTKKTRNDVQEMMDDG